MRIVVAQSEFIKTAADASGWPEENLPEFAFVGRSNVGKSSMLNALVARKKLARVSSTPGRTRHLQFFRVCLLANGVPVTVRLCDLPGYGYAKVPKQERAKWGGMIEGYLKGRDGLAAVVLIVDSRRPPTPEDLQAQEFLRKAGATVVVAATKIDKLAKNRRLAARTAIERHMGLAPGSALMFSSHLPLGLEDMWQHLLELAGLWPVPERPGHPAG